MTPYIPPEAVVGGGGIAILVMAGSNAKRMGGGIRGFFRWAGGWDRKLVAIEVVSEKVAPIADKLQELADKFEQGGSRIEGKLDALIEDHAATATLLKQHSDELVRLRHEDEALAESIDQLREEHQHEAQVAFDVLTHLARERS